ncbi:hypothetical protein [Rhodoferax sp.]|uniref:hypothetical protein n=1 Tax=Rhodoferax sp. TaxID=50421 RepID=UPI0025DF8C2C|nr:hypothetical protein [Rhodoferax sp.]MCM2295550.1 hypothetical protein [Rhodoferax sp.]
MKYYLSSFLKEWTSLVLLIMTLGGCAIKPSAPPASPVLPTPTPTLKLEKHHVELGAGVSVDYQIERKISSINGISCYAFITGTLNNDSNQVLSRQTVIDFNFFSGGKQSFRDLTHPVSNAYPGSRPMFEMVVSPVHREGCVNYDRIEVAVRKVVVN